MSTRATIHFQFEGQTHAIIYRHGDGYPEGLGADLQTFFTDVQKQTKDTRFHDPCYLAAKWVVWDAAQMAKICENPPLAFLSVGVVMEDPGDIRYRYLVKCDVNKIPKVVVEEV